MGMIRAATEPIGAVHTLILMFVDQQRAAYRCAQVAKLLFLNLKLLSNLGVRAFA